MKKSTLLIAILIVLFGFKSFGQTQKAVKADTTKSKPAPFVADPSTVYTINGREGDLAAVLNSASFGIDSYLMKTEIPANRLEQTKKYIQQVLNNMYQQIRLKYVADSMAYVKKFEVKK